ncbi:MAG TPA: hypothetical protein VN903_36185, partial [Polyangia bacterium]|nr:hypothetical protein [Polyangia bacterium]
MVAIGCTDGVYRDPIGHASGDAGQDDGKFTSTLSGLWRECGRLGTGAPWKVTISAEGGTAAVLYALGQIAVHRLSDGEMVAELAASVAAPVLSGGDLSLPSSNYDVALSSDGSVVAFADGFHVVVWRFADNAPPLDVPGLYDRVRLSPRGDQFLTWRSTPDPLFTIERRATSDGSLIESAEVSAVAFSGDGAQIISWRDGTLMTRPTDATGTAGPPVSLDASLTQAMLSPDGRYLVGAVLPNLRAFRTSDGQQLWDRVVDAGDVRFSADGASLLIFVSTGISIVDVATGADRPLLPLDPVRDAALGPNGGPLLVADQSGLYRAADAGAPLAPYGTLPGQGFSIMALAVSPDQRWLAAASDLRRFPAIPVSPIRPQPEDLVIWDLDGRSPSRTFSGLAATSVEFSRDGQRLLITDRRVEPAGRLEEWPVADAAPAWTLTSDGPLLYTASYSPDGGRIAVSFADGVGVLSDGDTSVAPTMAREIAYPASAFSPDGRWLATSGVSLWQTTDWHRVWAVTPSAPPPVEPVARDNALVFSPDGKFILSSESELDYEGDVWVAATTTKLYRTSDGRLIRNLGTQAGRRPVFSPDGAWLLFGDLAWE